MVNVWSMTKKGFCFKNPFFAKNAIFSKIMLQSKDFFWYSKPHIYPSTCLEMEELQLRFLKKQLMTMFFYFGAKRPFFQKKMAAPSKKCYSPKYVYWYQCFSV